MQPRIPFVLRVAALFAMLLVLLVPLAAAAAPPPPVEIQFLNVSDWHAQLEPLAGNIGGAAALAAYWQQDREANPNTLTLTAGDAFGASPPISNFFNEEPAILALRMMGVQVDTFGNHNFDRGVAHLQQMIDLARAKKGAQPGSPFVYVSANLENRNRELKHTKNFKIFKVGKIKIGVVGITNPEAPTLVFPGNFGSIVPTDPYAAANKFRAEAEEEGAKIVVAITHMGVEGFNNGQPFGPLIDFANNVSGFDVIFGDHTDVQYSGVINNQLVLENRSKGLTYARTKLVVQPDTGQVLNSSVEFITPTVAGVTPNPDIAALVASYQNQLAPIFNVVLGDSTVVIPRADACLNGVGRTCESKIGNFIADAMRNTYGTDFAITNSGGIRADLTCPTVDNPSDFCPSFIPPPFPITRGQVQTVLPFGNAVVTLAVNGAELKTMLENGVSAMPAANGRFPQVSGLCFTYDISAPAGSRVLSAVRQASDGSCTGAAVDLTAASSYTIAENDFMASGGDGYPVFFSRATTRDVMANAVANYVTASSPVTPAIQGRVNCTSSGATACPVVTP
ncbi:MAG: 5'-nucleotidase C-terminal domain-containing protein [Chloroflexi bacterium]|nr:5'-nucleotidase C-terminal domain-containing protein [Chloroflexota bacterium]